MQYVCMHVRMCVHTCICLCVCVSVCLCVCVYVSVCTVFAGVKRSLQGHRAAELLCIYTLGYCDQ